MIPESMWDEEWFLELSMAEKLVWIWSLTTEYSMPGLIRGSILSFADQLRMPISETESCFNRLISRGKFEFDSAHRLLRIDTPILGCSNPNILSGWYCRWQRLPESIVKYNHIATVRHSVSDRKWFRKAWKASFGKVEVPASKRESGAEQLRLIVPDQQQSAETETVREPLPERLKPELNDPDCLNSQPTVHKTVSTSTSTSTSTSEGGSGPTTPATRAERLWATQEAYRAELKLTPVRPSAESLEQVEAALAELGFDEAQAMIALGSYRDQCRRDITKSRYFNGRTNWDPQNMQIAASLASPQASSPAPPRGRDFTQERLDGSHSPSVPRDDILAWATALTAKSGQGPTEGSS